MGNIDNIVMRLEEKDAEAWSCMLKSASLQEPELALAVSSWAQGRQKSKPRAAMLEESHPSLGGWPGSAGGGNQEASPHTYNKDPKFIMPAGNQLLSNLRISQMAASADSLLPGWGQMEAELTCHPAMSCYMKKVGI